MIETNPFSPFVPKNAKYILIGSFGGKMGNDNNYDWYYGTKRNQFWTILRAVYNLPLVTRNEKQKLFSDLKLAITDIILSCERKNGTNLDNNLTNITYNDKKIAEIFKQTKIEKIFFSSRFVEKLFKKVFKEFVLQNPNISLTALPSPSPRYAQMTKQEKIAKYKQLLPRIKQ